MAPLKGTERLWGTHNPQRGQNLHLRKADQGPRAPAKDRTLSLADTKNGEPLMLPLSDVVLDLLSAREAAKGKSRFVFPGKGKRGHLIEPKRDLVRVREACGIPFLLHDLRRTFVTTAEGLDLSVYAIKRLVNHKMNSDVTAGYIVSDVERLREPMQRIADKLSMQIGLKPSNVVQFPGTAKPHKTNNNE